MYNRRLKRSYVLRPGETSRGNTSEELKLQDCRVYCRGDDHPWSKLCFASGEFIIVKEIKKERNKKERKKERERERERERGRFCMRLKLNRISVQRRSTVFLHNSCREGEKSYCGPRNGCSNLARPRVFPFKLFSVRWRVLRNNPFIKVICETASSKQRAPRAAQFVGFDVSPP